MNYKQAQKEFKRGQINKSLALLKWTRAIYYLIDFLNQMDNVILKCIVILFGFQYDVYIKLHEVSYNNDYLVSAESVKHQIEITINALGE